MLIVDSELFAPKLDPNPNITVLFVQRAEHQNALIFWFLRGPVLLHTDHRALHVM